MDDPKIKLYPDGKSGDVAAWNWELLLKGKKIAGGKSPGTQEAAFVAARAELVKPKAAPVQRQIVGQFGCGGRFRLEPG